MDFTVFYAWQSDRPEKMNRYLIRDSVKTALKQIGKEDLLVQESPRVDLEVRSLATTSTFVGLLDHDTKGVSGTPDIVGTIFDKIDKCGVFLADITFVAGTDDNKLVPNPNVILEMGYAARSIGWDRIICVQNEAFGHANENIFDIRHRRWPIVYNLTDGTPKDTEQVEKKKLIGRLKESIKEVLNNDHRSVEDAIAKLTWGMYTVLSHYPLNGNRISPIGLEPNTLYQRPQFQWMDLAIERLLDLNLIKYTKYMVNEEKGLFHHSYECTYIGNLVLKKLGFLK